MNQLMTFLDKGSTVKETLGVRSENSALRAVRAKREADEAGQCRLCAALSSTCSNSFQTKNIARGFTG